MRYRSLDGLRGVAAYTVVISHFSNKTGIFGGALGYGGGQVGVMLFFVLSGFLMGRLYLEKPFDTDAVITFFCKRAARVLPLYLIIVILSYGWLTFSGYNWPFYPVSDENILAHLAFWRGVSILWTIPVEVQFYLVFPLIWYTWRFIGWTLFLWLALVAAALTVLGLKTPAFIPYLPFFFFGIAAALLPAPNTKRATDLLFILTAAAYFISLPGVRDSLGLGRTGMWGSPLYMLLIPTFLLSTLYSHLANLALGNRIARFFGDISYSAYLLHSPILLVLAKTPIASHNGIFLPVYLTITTGISAVFFYRIERPARVAINNLRAPKTTAHVGEQHKQARIRNR